MSSDGSLFLGEVFTLSGVPKHTFVKPVQYNTLIASLRTPGRGLVLEGPSGIGKTTSLVQAMTETGMKFLKLEARRKEDADIIASLPTMTDLGIVVIDDFHRLDSETKKSIADLMKVLADDQDSSSKVVVIGINKAGDSLIAFGRDLNDRIDTIKFETNPEARVVDLIQKGEAALNIEIQNREEIAREANGSFHIAQLLCHELCLIADVLERCKEKRILEISLEVVRERVLGNQGRSFLPIAKKFATGPRFRREGRAPYLHLLRWLAASNEWSLSLRSAIAQNPELKGSVSQIVDKNYLRDFLAENTDLSDVLHYDSDTQILSAEDPKFLYFLRNIGWNVFARQVGFVNVSFERKYDFALSFAGSDRDIAEMMFSILSEAECEVFYDFNEQHRIAAENLEEYLGPIYRSEAYFVIAILGPDYPKRIWAKFESDQFKERFGDGSVIPVWDEVSPPTFFDVTFNVGGYSYNRTNGRIAERITEIANSILLKLYEAKSSTMSSPDQTAVVIDDAELGSSPDR